MDVLITAERIQQRCVGRKHHRTAFVEEGERVPDAAAALRLLAQCGAVPAVELALGLRIAGPHEHVEDVVPVVAAELERTRTVERFLVRLRGWGHEVERRARRRLDVARRDERLQRVAGWIRGSVADYARVRGKPRQ